MGDYQARFCERLEGKFLRPTRQNRYHKFIAMEDMINKLIQNSKYAQLACIEIHNKPIFPFRYEVCTILNINSWELLLKAFILRNYPDVKVLNSDGTTKAFDKCLAFVASELGNSFTVARVNIEKIYEYRCNIMHFYQDDIEILLCSLLGKNILLYHEFLVMYFGIDISNETNLILLPIGFKKPASPIDFLSNTSAISESSSAVQSFVKGIIRSSEEITEEGIEDSILFSFIMSLINESRIKNADIIAAITKDNINATLKVSDVFEHFTVVDDNTEGVRKIKIDEESIYRDVYNQTHQQVVFESKNLFSDFVQNSKFNKIMHDIKGNPTFHKKRYLDVERQIGGYKDYYAKSIYDELAKHYILK